MEYRKDIDGLRALAIIPVLFFHLGLLPNGYLGVDVFYTISGYLITRIVYCGFNKGDFSLRTFYLKRVARIVPVVSIVTITVLILGYQTMLPDDLENLSQSVIATNLFSNNILQLITTRNYWDVVNDYKPLLHTWSLGIEEQYYLLYPAILIITAKFKKVTFLHCLIFLTSLSIILYLFYPTDSYTKFYLLPFRFFQIGIGGIFAIFTIKCKPYFLSISLLVLVFLLTYSHNIPTNFASILISIFSVIIISNTEEGFFGKYLLTNKVAVTTGLVSFSLYMWHQPVISFVRYLYGPLLDRTIIVETFIVFTLIALISFHLIEKPARRLVTNYPNKAVPILLSINFVIICLSYNIYTKEGVVRDIPILGRIMSNKSVAYSHGEYNERVRTWEVNKNSTTKKVMTFGNSYARDFANILFEKYGSSIDIGYKEIDVSDPLSLETVKRYLSEVDLIFIENADFSVFGSLDHRVFCVGPKNFGENNGKLWNNFRHGNKIDSIEISKKFIELNQIHKQLWGKNYVDLLSPLLNKGKVRCVDNEGYLLSEDCRHLTREGAVYFSEKLSSILDRIIQN